MPIRTVILSGGTEVVNAHGTDLGAQISGGTQVVSGVASGATVFSGAQLVRAGGTASDTAVSGGSAVVSAGGTALDVTIGNAGTVLILSGGVGVAQSGGTLANSGSLINSGTINVADGGTLALYAPVVSNKGTINLQGVGGGAGGTLLLDPVGGQVVLSGGGKIALSSSGNNFFSVGTTTTLTNLDNTIVGAGNLGDGSTPLILVNGGTINANSANALTINVPEPITNSGIMEATGTGGLFISTNNELDNTGGKVEAIGTRATTILNVFSMPKRWPHLRFGRQRSRRAEQHGGLRRVVEDDRCRCQHRHIGRHPERRHHFCRLAGHAGRRQQQYAAALWQHRQRGHNTGQRRHWLQLPGCWRDDPERRRHDCAYAQQRRQWHRRDRQRRRAHQRQQPDPLSSYTHL